MREAGCGMGTRRGGEIPKKLPTPSSKWRRGIPTNSNRFKPLFWGGANERLSGVGQKFGRFDREVDKPAAMDGDGRID